MDRKVNKTTAALLAIFLGSFGVHKFYLGQKGAGALYLLFFWTYIPLVIGLVEGIYYLTMKDEKFQGIFGPNGTAHQPKRTIQQPEARVSAGPLPKDVRKFQDSSLMPGEQIITYCDGLVGEFMGKGESALQGGFAILTDRRVVFFASSWLASTERFDQIALNNISSIGLNKHNVKYVIRIHASGGQVAFAAYDEKAAKRFVAMVEDQRFKAASPQLANAPRPADDPLSALQKLSELRDAGAITDAEFTAKKAQLLERV
jgi:TM2 domain-containing membrane protein YozV